MQNTWNHRLPQNQRRSKEQMAEYLLASRNVTDSGCWEWTKSLSKSGYGKIKWREYGDLRVHRVAAFLWLEFPLTDTRIVCHHCDNRKCFNPVHLFIGTHKDNQQDSVRKGRHWLKSKTHCKHGHELSPENTYFRKNGYRSCRSCHRDNQREWQRLRRVSQ